jgi:acyl-CoA synthetase (AMP-forming)/AMP-acid ligase II
MPLLPRLHDYVDHWAAIRPHAEAAVFGDTRWTWTDLRARVAHLAGVLGDNGVGQGDRVAVLANPTPNFLATFLAVLKIGAVYQGLNPKYTQPELAFALDDAKPKLIVDILGASSRSETNASRSIREYGNVLNDPGRSFLATELEPPTAAPLPSGDSDVDRSPGVLVYTSGTTGKPKGALLPHRGLTLCAYVQAQQFDLPPGTRVLCNLPINHVGGLVDLTAMALACGGTLIFQERFDAAGAVRLTEMERVNFWLAVPAMFALMAQTDEFGQCDLSSLRQIVWSGGPMSLQLAQVLRDKCDHVANAFGMTETVGNVLFTSRDAALETCCETVGRPVDPYEVKIVGPDGLDCETGHEGEILVRSDSTMLEYLGRPDATADTIDPDGWVHTGDVARKLESGNFVLVGRRSDMFKSGGFNVYPREVELALEEHPSVDLAAVVGAPDELYGETGHAFLRVSDPNLSEDELRSFLRQRLANYKLPKTMTVMPELPRLAIGKVDKVELRRRVAK